MIRLFSVHSRPMARLRRGACGAALAALALGAGGPWLPVAQPVRAQESTADAGGAFSLASVQALVARGDGAVAAGNLGEARRYYDQAREASKRLLSFYRDLSGAFRGLDARIPREMDQRGRQTLELLADVNLRLAALFRRQNQPEVAVPLLVDVVRTMTPTTDQGRRAYQQLVEIGFVTTPYLAGGGAAAGAGGAAGGGR
ncbi:MAG: hypothetical protein VKN13_00430 [Cyanobacteriota bacterium]|nr:hypothetical protein [Cyanobacteriota bacterium]